MATRLLAIAPTVSPVVMRERTSVCRLIPVCLRAHHDPFIVWAGIPTRGSALGRAPRSDALQLDVPALRHPAEPAIVTVV